MGTNYYGRKIPTAEEKKAIFVLIENDKYKEAADLFPQEIHLGKASTGWAFCFNHNNWYYFDASIESVKKFISKCEIVDEYGQDVSNENFWNMVEEKKGGLKHDSYMDKWHEIHPGIPKPYYANQVLDFEVDGLVFSTSADFS